MNIAQRVGELYLMVSPCWLVLSSLSTQATVLEEMPPFPERESSILAKLKRKKGPGHLPDIDDARRNVNGNTEHTESSEDVKKVTEAPGCRQLAGALDFTLNPVTVFQPCFLEPNKENILSLLIYTHSV